MKTIIKQSVTAIIMFCFLFSYSSAEGLLQAVSDADYQTNEDTTLCAKPEGVPDSEADCSGENTFKSNVGLLDNDNFPDLNTVSIVVIDQPTNGSLLMFSDDTLKGYFTYNPDLDFNGVDTFTHIQVGG